MMEADENETPNEERTMYHGSRHDSLSFFPAICFTADRDAAAAYGANVSEVTIDRSRLTIQTVEMTADELRAAIDDQEWPCDRTADIAAAIAEGYDAVAYVDCDEHGTTHDCLRILTADAFAAAVAIVR